MVIQAYFGEKVYTMKPLMPPIETNRFRINDPESGFRMIKIPLLPER